MIFIAIVGMSPLWATIVQPGYEPTPRHLIGEQLLKEIIEKNNLQEEISGKELLFTFSGAERGFVNLIILRDSGEYKFFVASRSTYELLNDSADAFDTVAVVTKNRKCFEWMFDSLSHYSGNMTHEPAVNEDPYAPYIERLEIYDSNGNKKFSYDNSYYLGGEGYENFYRNLFKLRWMGMWMMYPMARDAIDSMEEPARRNIFDRVKYGIIKIWYKVKTKFRRE